MWRDKVTVMDPGHHGVGRLVVTSAGNLFHRLETNDVLLLRNQPIRCGNRKDALLNRPAGDDTRLQPGQGFKLNTAFEKRLSLQRDFASNRNTPLRIVVPASGKAKKQGKYKNDRYSLHKNLFGTTIPIPLQDRRFLPVPAACAGTACHTTKMTLFGFR